MELRCPSAYQSASVHAYLLPESSLAVCPAPNGPCRQCLHVYIIRLLVPAYCWKSSCCLDPAMPHSMLRIPQTAGHLQFCAALMTPVTGVVFILQVVDLEVAADHRGSILGDHPTRLQPPQKMFESKLLHQMRHFSVDGAVFIESESSLVGRRQVPNAMWKVGSTSLVWGEEGGGGFRGFGRGDSPGFCMTLFQQYTRGTQCWSGGTSDRLISWQNLAKQCLHHCCSMMPGYHRLRSTCHMAHLLHRPQHADIPTLLRHRIPANSSQMLCELREL